jgi:glycosyltransferase involved in cell wall biosynthesis
MAWKLLLPWLCALIDAGYEVHIACARTKWFEQLAGAGFHMHEVPLRRRLNPLMHFAPLWALYQLIRHGRFALVNTHSPVAAAVGRVAGWLAGAPKLIYTVHGFYFHDKMPWWQRKSFIALEWLLGRITDGFMFVSDEDHQTALQEGIAKDTTTTVTIYNGVNLDVYVPKRPASLISGVPNACQNAGEIRNSLKISQSADVVGIVGRVVREKGYIEFAEMAKLVSARWSNACFLVVGDALPSDRDGIVAQFRRRVEAAGLLERFRFTGFTDRVVDYLHVMDIFVLPSYREGFPRSVLEAMGCELPVIATNIRGCREAVVDGETGLLVPPRDGAALAEAVHRLLRNPSLAHRMGAAGRERVVHLYDERLVKTRFVEAIERSLNQGRAGKGTGEGAKRY